MAWSQYYHRQAWVSLTPTDRLFFCFERANKLAPDVPFALSQLFPTGVDQFILYIGFFFFFKGRPSFGLMDFLFQLVSAKLCAWLHSIAVTILFYSTQDTESRILKCDTKFSWQMQAIQSPR